MKCSLMIISSNHASTTVNHINVWFCAPPFPKKKHTKEEEESHPHPKKNQPKNPISRDLCFSTA